MTAEPSADRSTTGGGASRVAAATGGRGGGEGRSGASLVALGILVSRIFGIVRESLRNAYLGATESIAGDAFMAAFRIPNMLQNLLGEGALSAAFIPVYSRLLADGDREEARRTAGAIAALVGLAVAVAVALGVAAAPLLVRAVASGFTGEKFDLTVQLIRILFPGAGLFVLSAWCLAIQNSHRKFLLSYLSPVAWNVAMIIAFVIGGRSSDLSVVARTAAWGSVIGAVAQVLVQLPTALRLLGGLRLSWRTGSAPVRTILRNFAPVGLSRGVVQVSALIDQTIASNLPNGLVALLGSAQTITMLPASLFGLAVSAAELPALSSATGTEEERVAWRKERLERSSRQAAYFVVPSAAAFILLGDALIRALFEYRRFGPDDTRYAWAILAASALGLVAGTLARLHANVYYAMHDTRTPVRFAMVRVVIGVGLGLLFALQLPDLLGIERELGGAGLALAGGIAAWTEFTLLRRGLQRMIGALWNPGAFLLRLWGAALAAGAVAFGAKIAVRNLPPIPAALIVFALFGAVYLGLTLAFRIPEANRLLARFRR